MTLMMAKGGQGVGASVLLLLPRGWCHFTSLPSRRLTVSCLAPRPGALPHSRSVPAYARQLRALTQEPAPACHGGGDGTSAAWACPVPHRRPRRRPSRLGI